MDPLIAQLSKDQKPVPSSSYKNSTSAFLSTWATQSQIDQEQQQPLLSSDLQPSKKGKKSWKNCWGRKWCWWVLLVLSLLILLFSLLTWFVFIPNYAQGQLNNSVLKVENAQMFNPMANGFQTALNITLSNLPTNLEAELGEMKLYVQYNGTEIGTLQMPAIKLRGASEENLLASSFFYITNEEWWIMTCRDMIQRKDFVWEMQGTANLKIVNTFLGSIQLAPFHFQKFVSFKGLDRLQTLNIKDMSLTDNLNWKPENQQAPENDSLQGVSLEVTTIIESPASFSLSLGDVSFALYYTIPNKPTLPVGMISASDMILNPGTNELVFKGALLNPDTLPAELKGDSATIRFWISHLMNRYINLEKIQLEARGFEAKSFFETQPMNLPLPPVIRWIRGALQGVSLTVEHRHDAERKGKLEIRKVEIERMKFKITKNKPYQPIVSGTVHAEIVAPFPIALSIEQAKQNISIYACRLPQKGPNDCEAQFLGHLLTNLDKSQTKEISASLPNAARLFRISVALNNGSNVDQDVTLQTPESKTAYKQFLESLFHYEKVPILVKGEVTANLGCGLGGPVFIEKVPFTQRVELDGLKDFIAGGKDAMKATENLIVQSIKSIKNGKVVNFQLPGIWLRRPSHQIGVEIDYPMEFDMYHHLDSDPILSRPPRKDQTIPPYKAEKQKIGIVKLRGLNLGFEGSCSTTIPLPLKNETFNAPDGQVYCSTPVPEGQFIPLNEDKEVCTNRTECVARSFLSSYVTGQALWNQTTRISLEATNLPQDLIHMKSIIKMPNLELTGYQPSYNSTRPPFPIVRRIIVKPTSSILSFSIPTFLDLYNPFHLPIRFYYYDIQTFYENQPIGRLHVNLTQYDPFITKPGYAFKGYAKRRDFPWQPEFGPFPSDICVENGDCQLAPIDLLPQRGKGPSCTSHYGNSSQITSRLESKINLSFSAIRAFWDSFWNKEGAYRNVTVQGRVLVGLGYPVYKGPQRRNRDPVPEDHCQTFSPEMRDPYWCPPNPDQDFVLTWLDFGQMHTQLWMKNFKQSDKIDPIISVPAGC